MQYNVLVIQAIVFDFGGVFLDAEKNPDIVMALADTMEVSLSLIKPIWKREYDNLLTGKISSKKYVGIVADELNCQCDVNKVYFKWADKAGITQDSVNHDLVDFINSLRLTHRVYVLSNMIDLAEEDEMLKRLRGQFDGYFTSYGLGARKPHPDIFRKFLALTNLRPNNCIFVDDDEKNTNASAALGFHSLKYEDVEKLKMDIDQLNLQKI